MTDLLPVTQADRDAVQAFHRTMAKRIMSDIASERPKLGEDEGDAGTLVQAFARHRIAAAPPVEGLTSGAGVLAQIEAEARRYASHYEQGSDGRNTFVMFADYVVRIAASLATHAGSVREVDIEAQARAIAQQVVPYEAHLSYVTKSQMERRSAAKAAARLALASLTDTGTAATIGGERA